MPNVPSVAGITGAESVKQESFILFWVTSMKNVYSAGMKFRQFVSRLGFSCFFSRDFVVGWGLVFKVSKSS